MILFPRILGKSRLGDEGAPKLESVGALQTGQGLERLENVEHQEQRTRNHLLSL